MAKKNEEIRLKNGKSKYHILHSEFFLEEPNSRNDFILVGIQPRVEKGRRAVARRPFESDFLLFKLFSFPHDNWNTADTPSFNCSLIATYFALTAISYHTVRKAGLIAMTA